MKVRMSMLSDQWPRSVQEDIAQVRASVEAMEMSLGTALATLFGQSDSIQEETRASILTAMSTDLAAIRTAVETTAAGAVVLPIYNRASSSGRLVGWGRIGSAEFYQQAGGATQWTQWYGTLGAVRFSPWTVARFSAELERFGYHVVQPPTELPPGPPRGAWRAFVGASLRRVLRTRWTPTTLGLGAGGDA